MKLCIIGHYGKGLSLLNGQTIKTKIFTEELQDRFGKKQVLIIDTYGGWKTFFKAPFQVFYALKKSTNVLIFPAHNGLRVYAPLLSVLQRFFKNKKLHYIVIGGWLPHFLKKRKYLSEKLKKFNGIYVETNTMKMSLELQGFKNIYVMPNFKKLNILSENDLDYKFTVPYKLCTFSRVMKEKGIEDAVNTVIKVNDLLGYQAFSLDIYGQVDSNQLEWFENIKRCFPKYIQYCGCVESCRSVEVLRDYFALLFPTRFFTEGIPGTIIDAYAAGVPVISAKWESFGDVVDEGVTGLSYEFGDTDELSCKLIEIAQNPDIIISKKSACIRKAQEFTAEHVMSELMENL